MPDSSNAQKVLKGISTQTLITILTGVIEILAFSIMSRLLTQQDFGYYAAVTAVSSIFVAFADAGIGSAIVQRKELDQKYIDNAFTLCLLFGVWGASLLVLCSGPAAKYVADESMQVPLMLVAITLLTGTLSSISFSIMQRKLQFLRMGLIRISALIFTTIVSIVLAIIGFGYYAIIAKVVLYSIITLIVSFFAARTKYHFSFNIKVYKEIFGFGGWLMASSILRRIAEQVDRLMMSSLFSVKTLGMYSRPKEFIDNMTGRLCSIFDSALFPALSSIQDDNERIIRSYSSTLYYLNIVGLMITFGFMYNSELLIRIFLGAEWMNVNNIFKVLSFTGVCMINGSIGDIFLRSLAFTKQQFFFRIMQAGLSIVFILILSQISVTSVAIGFLLAYSLVVIIKMGFIANKIEYGLNNAIAIILKSYKISLVYVPIYILCAVFLPNTIGGNIIKTIIFCIVTIVVFFVVPEIVGKKYKVEMYNKVNSALRNRLLSINS